MTVANNYAPVVTAANGSTTVFSGSWNAISASYLVVQLLDTTTGIYTSISQGVGSNQYQVTSLTSSGFVITFNTAPVSGNNVVITRLTTPQQTVPYTTSRGFQGSVEEGSFDILTTMIQENNYNNTLAIQAPTGDTAINLILPRASQRANQSLIFDASGNVTVGSITSAVVSAAMVPVVEAATLPLARAAMGAASLTSGQLQSASSTTVALMPYKGNQVVFPNNYVYTIPSSGLSSGSIAGSCYLNGTANSTLTANTLYYAYLWYNNGSPVIDFSTTGHATDSTTGIEIKSGDSTRVLLGMIYPQSGPVVVDSTAARLVASWHNRINKYFSNTFSTARSTSSGTEVEINSEIRGSFLTWGDGITLSFTGYVTNTSTTGAVNTWISIDGISTNIVEIITTVSASSALFNTSGAPFYAAAEGEHYVTIAGSVNSGTGQWQSGNALGGQVLI